MSFTNYTNEGNFGGKSFEPPPPEVTEPSSRTPPSSEMGQSIYGGGNFNGLNYSQANPNLSSPQTHFVQNNNNITHSNMPPSNYQFTNPWQPGPPQLSPPQQQRRPSSLDSMNIWGSTAGSANVPSIWANPGPYPHRTSLPSAGSIGDVFGGNKNGPNFNNPTPAANFNIVPNNRRSFGDVSFSSDHAPVYDMHIYETAHNNNNTNMGHMGSQFDFNSRRHSYAGDSQMYQKDHISPRFQPAALDTSKEEEGETCDQDSVSAVHEYFTSDPHERVRVTKKFLNERFFEEEKYLTDAYQLPNFPVENSLRNYQLVLVGFKAGRIDVFYLPMGQNESWMNDLKIGDLVIVEADRGRDLGKVFKLNISIDEARLMKLLQFQEQQAALSDLDSQSNSSTDTALSIKNIQHHSSPPTLHFPKPIIGLAQPNEISQISNKKQDEEKACRLCLAKISNTTTIGQSDLLQMKLIDAEYQFDRKKLIFYYSTSKRIDFRDLVRELFRIYKTRIWMCAVIGLPYVPGQQNQSQKQQLSQKSSTQHDNTYTQGGGGASGNGGFYSGSQNKKLNGHQGYNMQNPQHFQQQQQQQQLHSNMVGSIHMNDTFRQDLNQGIFGNGSVPNNLPQIQRQNSLTYQNLINPYAERRQSHVGSNQLMHTGPDQSRFMDVIPRKFNGLENREDPSTNESFVLKSLVDSIDH
ncbi:hypothetical protein CAAN1_07S04830 [[Candida] anglica]|uniref:PSP1 C-terminal domain-containing protein n=1 Tax=[Candida] anglica TaxID=148631 RepID=A0ABP0EBE3_9ASCO